MVIFRVDERINLHVEKDRTGRKRKCQKLSTSIDKDVENGNSEEKNFEIYYVDRENIDYWSIYSILGNAFRIGMSFLWTEKVSAL